MCAHHCHLIEDQWCKTPMGNVKGNCLLSPSNHLRAFPIILCVLIGVGFRAEIHRGFGHGIRPVRIDDPVRLARIRRHQYEPHQTTVHEGSATQTLR